MAIAAAEARPDFKRCFNDFINETDKYVNNESIIYQGNFGPFYLPDPEDRRSTMSTEGCRILCGSGTQYYPWGQVAGTITTWVLPVIGLLLQAPYESNAFRKTLYALVRWLGSPIASLSYILWNIKIIGKCALLSDMSTSYGIGSPTLRSADWEDVRDMRDSLYILSVMNQYTVKSPIDPNQAETLLRVVLFADLMTGTLNLKERRQKLAGDLREGRKRAVVPVFITLMWFFFSLAVSIESAFSAVGDNYTAHDIAIGLLLAWLPVLILSSVVDRNPTQTTASCTKLNKLLREVQVTLRTDGAAKEYTQTITDATRKLHKNTDGDVEDTNCASKFTLDWVGGQGVEASDETSFDQENPPPLASNFFNEFAGQGRVRWHYGVAHTLLSGMETVILDKCENRTQRNWLQIPNIRNNLVHGHGKGALLLDFDLREFWEILSAFIITVGTVSGAFVLSFRTPTIGLGCRAGGYLIFGVIAAGIFLLELVTWSFIVAPTQKRLNKIGQNITEKSRKQTQKWTVILNWIFRFCEMTNTIWLIYIVMAQTLGSYETCDCQAATWGLGGGYIDAKVAQKADRTIVECWWITGVLLSSLIMLTAIAFLVIEWCEQSHLNSIDRQKAMQGLKVTQHFKYRTIWIRRTPVYIIELVKALWRTFSNTLWNRRSKKEKKRRGIVWSS